MCNGMADHIQRNTLTHYRFNVKPAINNISNEHFWLLIELSGIRSDKIIMSLREHLVDGFTKREVCERNDVSLSYFSIKHIFVCIKFFLPSIKKPLNEI